MCARFLAIIVWPASSTSVCAASQLVTTTYQVTFVSHGVYRRHQVREPNSNTDIALIVVVHPDEVAPRTQRCHSSRSSAGEGVDDDDRHLQTHTKNTVTKHPE